MNMKTPHKNAPHKHAELIKAWADGAEIEFYDQRFDEHRWQLCGEYPYWQDDVQFRIKPEPKPDVVREYWVMQDVISQLFVFQKSPVKNNLKLTFDGETGELKSAEVL